MRAETYDEFGYKVPRHKPGLLHPDWEDEKPAMSGAIILRGVLTLVVVASLWLSSNTSARRGGRPC